MFTLLESLRGRQKRIPLPSGLWLYVRNNIIRNNMYNFKLEILFRVFGIGSASGLIYVNDSLFIVSDYSGWLYEYHLTSKTLEKIQVVEGEIPEIIPKKIKPDFEAIASKDNTLYLFGSGSTDARQVMYTVELKDKQVGKHDLTHLYKRMRDVSKISTDDLNIEGALFFGEKWYLFQRGNGAKGENGVFLISGDITKEHNDVSYHNVVLPKINGVAAGFTDAVAIGDAIYFLASAEDTVSTYEDGDVAGSIIGKLDLKTFAVIYTTKVSDTNKFEGLTFFEENDQTISFLLCEDNDTDVLESEIFKLEINK
ncbi:MAG TPA: hypothetical protein VGB44_02955 [Flavobacterium sp.]